MKIGSSNLHNMQNGEHFQFHTEFCDLVNLCKAENLGIRSQFDLYLVLYAQEDEAFKKIMKSAITADMQKADKRRDTLFRGMIDTNKAALNHFRPDMQKSAKRLKILFDTYGNLAQKPLNEQTAGIYNLLQELRGNYAGDAATVHIAEWANELEKANLAFGQLVRNRNDKSAERTNLILKEVRAQVDEAYRAITGRINALVIVEGTTKYEDFIRNLNVIVVQYNNAIAQRAGRSKAVNENAK